MWFNKSIALTIYELQPPFSQVKSNWTSDWYAASWPDVYCTEATVVVYRGKIAKIVLLSNYLWIQMYNILFRFMLLVYWYLTCNNRTFKKLWWFSAIYAKLFFKYSMPNMLNCSYCLISTNLSSNLDFLTLTVHECPPCISFVSNWSLLLLLFCCSVTQNMRIIKHSLLPLHTDA